MSNVQFKHTLPIQEFTVMALLKNGCCNGATIRAGLCQKGFNVNRQLMYKLMNRLEVKELVKSEIPPNCKKPLDYSISNKVYTITRKGTLSYISTVNFLTNIL